VAAQEEAMEEEDSCFQDEKVLTPDTHEKPLFIYRPLADMSAYANEEETISCD
jgi:hypothetical protein